MRAMATGDIKSGWAKANILDMINAITDQGEGQGIAEEIRKQIRARGLLEYAPVQEQFQPDEAALNYDYPSFTDTGAANDPSGNTVARSKNAAIDHQDRFKAIKDLLESGKVVTWDQWHSSGNKWTADMLKTTGYDDNTYPIPKAEDIAGALNTLKQDPSGHDTFSKAAVGSIAGITRVLSGYWTNETTSFPFPSMYGSGDRVSICWAVSGAGTFGPLMRSIFQVAGVSFECLAVPGHSPAHVAFYAEGELFSGDLLFAGSVGRVDLPGADWDTLLASVRMLAERLPPETVVHPGHGPETTLGVELARNPFLAELRAQA